MRRATTLILATTALLAMLLVACQRAPLGGSLTLDGAPTGALITVANDVDGSVVYEGPGEVTLNALPAGPYVVMLGDGDAMQVQFVTLAPGGAARVTFAVMPMARGGNPGNGGHTTTATNNLSFPVIWAENGASLTVPGAADQPKLTVPYDVTGDGTISGADMVGGYYQFAQKVAGNVWQAGSVAVHDAPVYVTEVDWSDSLESIDGKVGRPLRIEVTLYKLLSATYSDEASLPSTLAQFPMTMLANPSSPDEIQGAGASAHPIDLTLTPPTGRLDQVNIVAGNEATVYASGFGLVIQPLVGPREDIAEGDLAWNGSQWVDASDTDPSSIEAPLSGVSFAGELNVAGKVIYGLSQGGWKPRATGDYRITFFLQPTQNTQLDVATIRASAEETVTAEAEPTSGGTAHVVTGTDPVSGVDRNLTYIDVRIVAGGGGGRK